MILKFQCGDGKFSNDQINRFTRIMVSINLPKNPGYFYRVDFSNVNSVTAYWGGLKLNPKKIYRSLLSKVIVGSWLINKAYKGIT